jgi:hypothetical protein
MVTGGVPERSNGAVLKTYPPFPRLPRPNPKSPANPVEIGESRGRLHEGVYGH